MDSTARPGSSPLTRGKQLMSQHSRSSVGLIPAHAGKTHRTAGGCCAAGAHPRSRGENFGSALTSCATRGSSPLTRGKRPCGSVGARTSAAHPRSRGENAASDEKPARGRGSSPLTRGKHFLTCAFIAQIDQILESLELCAFSESYSSQDVYATDAPRDRVRSIGLAPRSSRGAS